MKLTHLPSVPDDSVCGRCELHSFYSRATGSCCRRKVAEKCYVHVNVEKISRAPFEISLKTTLEITLEAEAIDTNLTGF